MDNNRTCSTSACSCVAARAACACCSSPASCCMCRCCCCTDTSAAAMRGASCFSCPCAASSCWARAAARLSLPGSAPSCTHNAHDTQRLFDTCRAGAQCAYPIRQLTGASNSQTVKVPSCYQHDRPSAQLLLACWSCCLPRSVLTPPVACSALWQLPGPHGPCQAVSSAPVVRLPALLQTQMPLPGGPSMPATLLRLRAGAPCVPSLHGTYGSSKACFRVLRQWVQRVAALTSSYDYTEPCAAG